MTPTILSQGLIPVGWFVVLLAAPGLLILVAVVVAFLFHRPVPPASPGGAESSDTPNGAGYYHVLGFDALTNVPREATLHADSEASARGQAELDGMVVTEVKAVGEGGMTR
jgi:hypothetical protein